MESSLSISKVPLEYLHPHEMCCMKRVNELYDEICAEGVWREPIIVSRHELVILDGHHRFAVAKRLNLAYIPAVIVDYMSDSIELSSWQEGWQLTKEFILSSAIEGRLLPIKTSRHKLSSVYPTVLFPLADLML